MYCPSCGTEVTLGLNYCNRCGANLSSSTNLPEQPVRSVNLTGPTIAIAAMVVACLAIILNTVTDLSRNNVHPVALTWIVIGSLGMIMGVAALIIRQWSHLAGIAKLNELRPLPHKKSADNESAPASQQQQLPPRRVEPVPSVTEHTTRTFEAAYLNQEHKK